MPNIIKEMTLRPTGRKFQKTIAMSPLEFRADDVTVRQSVLDEYVMEVIIRHQFRSSSVCPAMMAEIREALARYVYGDVLDAASLVKIYIKCGDYAQALTKLKTLEDSLLSNLENKHD